MAEMLLTIEHDGTVFTPPVKDEIKIEWERKGTPGKLTFTTVKVDGMNFEEGDAVCFYYNNKNIFMGYVFTKKRDKKQQIEVTCYDQMRYLKNKYTYVFEKKTATQIIQALCKDYNLHTGTFANTNYVIPSVVEENISAIDIVMNTLDETLLNTGKMFTLYDDFGRLTLKNVENMISETLVFKDTAENFDYSSSIDKETYNNIVLYYKPQSATTSSTASSTASTGISSILNIAASQIGTTETDINRVKYNTAYYGSNVSGSSYPWCCVFVWWVFREAGLSNLFYGGNKTASCGQLLNWFKNKGAYYRTKAQPGDIVFFNFNGGSSASHVGIVESVKSDGSVVTIEGNCSNSVKRMTRRSGILGYGRPAYTTSNTRSSSSSSSSSSSAQSSSSTAIQVFSASNNSKIDKWGTLRYFEEIKDPSVGQIKAKQLLELYCRKTRELKVTGQYGDPTVRGGTLIPVILDVGDTTVNNYMLVDKVTHVFKNDHHTMDLTLEGAWLEDDNSKDKVSQYNTPSISNVGSNTNSNTVPSSSGNVYGTTANNDTVRTMFVNVKEDGQYTGLLNIQFCGKDKKQRIISMRKGQLGFEVLKGSEIVVTIKPADGHSYNMDRLNVIGYRVSPNSNTFKIKVDSNIEMVMRWVK